ncbi:MAG: exonuclease SbcCD subunit D C-terminal domain-containing protein, partial [Clostridium sp.]|nr:exonuclease SbcCD subunit D C-terminal domain-containing protein [Clostridium sp.]
LKEALRALAELDDGCPDYVRLLVDEEGVLDADAEARAFALAEGKKCRLCEIKKAEREGPAGMADGEEAHEIDEIRRMAPIGIALEAYRRRNGGQDMPERLREMLERAIGEAAD